MSMEVLKDHKDKFGVSFDENKEALNKISTITSKILKNELAGYITKFIKNELRNEREKIESAENEEQISEDTEPTKDESKSEVIVEEPTKDESKSEVIVEESSATTKLQD